MEQNEFFPLKGYEQEYEWNPTTEEARGLKRGKVKKWQYDGKQGRPYVQLCKNGVRRIFYKYMFVYSHAHQVEIPLGFDVHHIDFNEDNNTIENLQLLTHEEHMKIHGLNEKAVVALDDRGNVVHRFASIAEAGRNGFRLSCVSDACRGCYSTHRGHYYKGLWWYFECDWLAMQAQQQQPQPTIKVDADGQFYFLLSEVC